MSRHIEELAELYALGSLSDREKAAVDRHVRTCVECANRIRAAEETIAFIADLEDHHPAPETIAESFAARLTLSRVAQKLLSLKVITSVFIIGSIALSLGLMHGARANTPMGKVVAEANATASTSTAAALRRTAFK